MNRKNRWPLDLKFRHETEREIYQLQARLYSDVDREEREDIRQRIDLLRKSLDGHR
jgi:hypothetical protein